MTGARAPALRAVACRPSSTSSGPCVPNYIFFRACGAMGERGERDGMEGGGARVFSFFLSVCVRVSCVRGVPTPPGAGDPPDVRVRGVCECVYGK